VECPKTITEAGQASVKLNVVYNAPAGSRPIIFHSTSFLWGSTSREGEHLYRRLGNKWEEVEYEAGCMAGVPFDDPDVIVNVSEDYENFKTLEPGHTFTISHRMDKATDWLPFETQVGDVFRYVFKGIVLDWWDWGDRTEHSGTTVTFPCFGKGKVLEPSHNDGRPKLVVPCSNTVEFTIV
jgi:hypothetical protein